MRPTSAMNSFRWLTNPPVPTGQLDAVAPIPSVGQAAAAPQPGVAVSVRLMPGAGRTQGRTPLGGCRLNPGSTLPITGVWLVLT